MTRFGVGDRVIIDCIDNTNEYSRRCTALFGDPYYGAGLNDGMYRYIGQEAVVMRIVNGYYRLSVDSGRWYWDDAMLVAAFDLDGVEELI